MPKFRITVSDTVTYERTWYVDIVAAKDEDEACERAITFAKSAEPDDEEEVNNTLYEADATEVFPYIPATCPSKHWNRGDDICADCGAELA